jgi:hypothetical protein
MATLDYTVGGSSTGTAVQFSDVHDAGCVHIYLDVATIIATDTTMTANAYIAIDDVIQVMNWPKYYVPTHSYWETVTAGTASATGDLGLAGGQEIDAGVAMDATAGTVVAASVPDANIDDVHAGGDTLDWEILTANLATGTYRWHLGFHYLRQIT